MKKVLVYGNRKQSDMRQKCNNLCPVCEIPCDNASKEHGTSEATSLSALCYCRICDEYWIGSAKVEST